jgi:hypothetical protein
MTRNIDVINRHTWILQDGHLHGVLGGSGGARIITSVAQVFLNRFVRKMGALPSVAAPRVHHQVVLLTVYFSESMTILYYTHETKSMYSNCTFGGLKCTKVTNHVGLRSCIGFACACLRCLTCLCSSYCWNQKWFVPLSTFLVGYHTTRSRSTFMCWNDECRKYEMSFLELSKVLEFYTSQRDKSIYYQLMFLRYLDKGLHVYQNLAMLQNFA